MKRAAGTTGAILLLLVGACDSSSSNPENTPGGSGQGGVGGTSTGGSSGFAGYGGMSTGGTGVAASAGVAGTGQGGTGQGGTGGEILIMDGGGGDGGAGVAGATGGTGGGTGGSGGGTGGSGGATGGSGGTTTAGSCARTVGSCASPEVSVTEVNVGIPVTPYGTEYDTQPLPMAIAAMPSGGSRITWLGTDGNAYVAQLDCNDQLVGSPAAIPAHDVQDIHADDEGGVLLLTRDATGSGADHCGPESALCRGESGPCYDMYLVRFDGSGAEQWATKVTNLSDSMEGYDNGARFVWDHYQHHGRIAFDGNNYAAYFCIGITQQNGACVDIHEGDRMQVVSSSGAPVAHANAFEVGCSHSWTSRIVWDPRNSQFVTVCATDRPAGGSPCQIARSPGYQTLAPVQCNGRFWGGDLVLASGGGYWTAYTQEGAINLVHFTDAGPGQTIDNAGSTDHAKLVTYGDNHMLLAWESGASMAAQVLDSAGGATVGSQLTIDVPDHNYHAFKAYPDGSVAYPAAGSNSTSIRIARVMPCQ